MMSEQLHGVLWPIVSRLLALTLLCLLGGVTTGAATAKTDYYVATHGNDSWSGRLAATNHAGTDGPFATVGRAQRALREHRPGGPATVLIRGGLYALAEPLNFTPEDSGTEAAPITYAAYPGEHPIISGGRRIAGWRVVAGGRWEATVPDVQSGAWNFAQLFVNGERRYRPRLPRTGYYTIAAEVPASAAAAGKGYDRFGFAADEIRSDWQNIGDVEVLPFHTWGMGRHRIASVDTAQHIVTFTGTTAANDWWANLPKGNRFLVENVREALDTPGQWYLDRASGVLTYLPLPGEEPARTEVIAPRLEQLLTLQGDVTGRHWVEHLTFRGLTFAHANWVTPPHGHDVPQAESDLTAAVSAVGTHNCAFDNCRIAHVGGYGLGLGEGSKHNTVENCELTDLGAGGIKLGEMEIRQDDETVASNNSVMRCLIAHGGRLHPAGIGVWIGESPDNDVTHNEIYDFYYTGISEGWTWGYGPSLARNNRIAYNHIHKIGQGVLSDMGGIYTLGSRPTTFLDHNLIHDIDSFSYGGWGIYFDEGSTGVTATNNVVYNTKSAGFHQHYGKENVVRNNIFAYGREAQLMRTRAEDHLSFTMEHNLVLAKGAPLLGSNWSGNNYRLDHNLYWTEGGAPAKMADRTWEQWQTSGQDMHSLFADPEFVAPAKGDFRLKPGSPAAKIGFQPIDLSNVGRGGKHAAEPDPPPAFPPLTTTQTASR